jgi:hypothetical protein
MKKYHEVHQVVFEGSKLYIHVDDQHLARELSEVSLPLLKATEDERNHYQVSPSGYGIHWPLIDEDLSIDGLLGIDHAPLSEELSA